MDKYLIGFLLGIAASWFWFYRSSSTLGFRQVLNKEMDKPDPGEWKEQLERKVEALEKRFCHLAEKSGAAEDRPSKAFGSVDRQRPDKRCEEVIRLWQGGCNPEEIIRTTGLAKAEVELILLLKDQRFKMKNN